MQLQTASCCIKGNTMSDYKSLLELLQKYTDMFNSLTENQDKKIQAVREYNNEALNECMKKEQADTLLLRGYDKKRVLLQEQLALKDMTFREMLPKLPEEIQPEFTQMLRRLGDSYDAYRVSADCAKQLIELNIYRLSGAIEELKKKTNTASGEVYTADGSINPENLSLRDMKI